MIPRTAGFAPLWAPLFAAAALACACTADRTPRAGPGAARPDSAPPALPGEVSDADSLAALVTLFEFAEAGGTGTVPALEAPTDTSVADRSQGASLLGSAGPYAFVHTWAWTYACGAHGGRADSFAVLSLAERRPVALLGDSARAALALSYLADVEAAFKADSATEPPFDPDSVALTMLIPRIGGTQLGLAYQFTAEACYACSDNRWSSYSRSVVVPARELPAALVPFAATPVEVQTAFRIQRVAPDSAAGWSEVVMATSRRDALARLFGVTAPGGGGREFLVWRVLPGGGGSFETVWLRGAGVEATIVGRQPGVWIAAGGRAWSWRSRTVTVPTIPCSRQLGDSASGG